MRGVETGKGVVCFFVWIVLFCFVLFGGLSCTARCKNNLHSNEFHSLLSGTLCLFTLSVFVSTEM